MGPIDNPRTYSPQTLINQLGEMANRLLLTQLQTKFLFDLRNC